MGKLPTKLPTKDVSFQDIDRLNRKQLQDLMEIDDDKTHVLEELVLVFEKTCREKMPKIKSSVERLDLQALKKEMHSFKVSCYNIGALRASEIAKEIHQLSSQPSPSKELLDQLIQQMESELESALIEIREICQ